MCIQTDRQTDTAAKVKVLLRQMKRRTFLHEDDPPSHDHMPSRLLGRITQRNRENLTIM